MLQRFLIAITALTFIAIGTFFYLQPIFPALVCPACFGFERVQGKLFIQHGLKQEEINKIKDIYLQSKERVAKVYGSLKSSPVVFICSDENHYRSIGGGRSKGQAIGNFAVRISPRGISPEIISHELAHTELKKHIGSLSITSPIPTWFDEGLAVLISNDKRYTENTSASDTTESETLKLRTSGLWHAAINAGKQSYAPAYSLVKKWHDKAGNEGLMELIQRIKAGEKFDSVYMELGDRP